MRSSVGLLSEIFFKKKCSGQGSKTVCLKIHCQLRLIVDKVSHINNDTMLLLGLMSTLHLRCCLRVR